jgi:hypothetical protein
MIAGPTVDDHHLIPKSKGGKKIPPVTMHIVCHRKIHSVFTDNELMTYYNTWERIQEHEQIASFIKWVSKKPAEYLDVHRETKSRKRKRR